MSLNLNNKFDQLANEESLANATDALRKNGFEVIVTDNLEAAKEKVLSIIPKGSEVFTVSSVTVSQAGLNEIINESGDYISTRKKFTELQGQEDKILEMKRIGSASEYVLGSVHAITEDGQALIASASGSQIPNYVFGANHVIWLVSTKKIVENLNEGFNRIENYVLQLEDERALKAYNRHSSLNKILIYRKETNNRVTVILIKEIVGF